MVLEQVPVRKQLTAGTRGQLVNKYAEYYSTVTGGLRVFTQWTEYFLF